jgi:hypothetical protein
MQIPVHRYSEVEKRALAAETKIPNGVWYTALDRSFTLSFIRILTDSDWIPSPDGRMSWPNDYNITPLSQSFVMLIPPKCIASPIDATCRFQSWTFERAGQMIEVLCLAVDGN